MQKTLDISSLKKAFDSFTIAYKKLKENREDLIVRDAVIQRFEYTYELSVKMIKRQLEAEASVPSDVDLMSFRDRMRYAAEKGLLSDPTCWFDFRDRRNITSHVYNEVEAYKIIDILPIFSKETESLILELSKRNAH